MEAKINASSNVSSYKEDDRKRRGLICPLFVYITQDTACSVQYISDRDLREHPIRRHG
jgi:hypothetical protein